MYYVNVNACPVNGPANRAIRMGINVRAESYGAALQLAAKSLELRGLRIVSIVGGA